MKNLITSYLLIISFLGNAFAQDIKVSLDQTHAKWLDSKFVGDRFLIKCYIPEQKTIPTESLPVIFVLDADMSFGLIYDIVRWLKWGTEFPYVAVVGISYGTGEEEWFVKRSRDFSESKDQTKHWGDFPLAGGAANFKEFIEKELFQFLETEYQLKGESKTLIGISFGGLFCADVLFSKPGLFDNYIILGPALLWNDKEIFKQESQYAKNHSTLNAFVFTSIGNLDDREDIIIPWEEFIRQVKTRNYRGLTMDTWIVENEDHMSMYPAAVTRGLNTVFRKIK